ncbi:glycosyltransferase family 2 protein [Flavobacterium sp. Arc2]|jgi:GT2 family glycosyltransferase|uniref:glycosyltransferase family 2 protein n=1 Tax=Flavobacterium sp. Arc2 TaxID=3046685 RepID=UPI00352CB48C
MEVSIIIVSYNCKSFVFECIDSIKKLTELITYEVIVVDNNSSDGIEDDVVIRYPDILFFKNDYNGGFGYANNIGLAHAKGKYVFFLNPDTLLLNNVCQTLYDYLELNNNVAALGCRVYDENLNNQMSYGKFPSVIQYLLEVFPVKWVSDNYKNKISSEGYLTEDLDLDVEFISGADLFVRKSVLDHIGGFDENFFLFFEEVDLCMRIKNAGYQIRITSQAKLIHLMGQTMQVSFQKFKWFEESRYVFLRKYYSKKFIVFSKSIFIFRYLFLWLKYLDKEWHKRAVFIYKLK